MTNLHLFTRVTVDDYWTHDICCWCMAKDYPGSLPQYQFQWLPLQSCGHPENHEPITSKSVKSWRECGMGEL